MQRLQGKRARPHTMFATTSTTMPQELITAISSKCKFYQHEHAYILQLDTHELLGNSYTPALLKNVMGHPFTKQLQQCKEASYDSTLYFYSPDGREFFQLNTHIKSGFNGIDYYHFATIDSRSSDESKQSMFCATPDWIHILADDKPESTFELPKSSSILMSFQRVAPEHLATIIKDMINHAPSLVPITFRKEMEHIFRKPDDGRYITVSRTKLSSTEVAIGNDQQWQLIPVDRKMIMRDHCGEQTIFFKPGGDFQKLLLPSQHEHKRKPGIYDAKGKKHNLTVVNLQQRNKLGLSEEPPHPRRTPLELLTVEHKPKRRR